MTSPHTAPLGQSTENVDGFGRFPCPTSAAPSRRWRACLLLCLGLATSGLAAAPPVNWQNLSSTNGDLPVPPGGSAQQTGAVVADFDGDGRKDFILSFRQKPPALVWYRRTATGWDLYVIEKDFLTVEAGGAVCDIDGDGDLDVVFGGDWQSGEVWWWENSAPNFDKATPWKRHVIKTGGKTQHHDQVFGDFLGIGRSQLAFWNQGAKTIFLAEIPNDPRHATNWPMTAIDGHLDIFAAEMAKWHENQAQPDNPNATAWIFYGDGQGQFTRTEMARGHGWHETRLADLDGDGRLDLLNKPYNWQAPRVDVWLNRGSR